MNKTFDETTYEGRFKKFLELTSVQHLFTSDAAIKKCKHSVEKDTKPTRQCEVTVAACVHPNTKEIIPAYGRMASFVPMNIPICAGMLLSAPTLPNLIGWQWFNQTYNAVFNYSNSAKSKRLESVTLDNPIMKGYAGSVIVSVGLAVGMTQWVKRASMHSSLKRVLQTVVPYVATSSAGVANVVLMRRQELQTGIPITTLDGTHIGVSKIAAKRALFETAVSRAVLPIPMLLVPPPLIAIASKFNVFTSSVLRRRTMELSMLLVAIGLGLPSALALYPQHTKVSINQLEKEFSIFAQQPMMSTTVQYNKGV